MSCGDVRSGAAKRDTITDADDEHDERQRLAPVAASVTAASAAAERERGEKEPVRDAARPHRRRRATRPIAPNP